MISKYFVVRKSYPRRRFSLIFGSSVRHPTGTRLQTFQPGSILEFILESPDGNVWFREPGADNRGKTESVSISSLINEELLEPLTREYLHEHGQCVVNHIHHEEYVLNGLRYFCGYESPSTRYKTEGGWRVYKAESEKKDTQ